MGIRTKKKACAGEGENEQGNIRYRPYGDRIKGWKPPAWYVGEATTVDTRAEDQPDWLKETHLSVHIDWVDC